MAAIGRGNGSSQRLVASLRQMPSPRLRRIGMTCTVQLSQQTTKVWWRLDDRGKFFKNFCSLGDYLVISNAAEALLCEKAQLENCFSNHEC